MGGAVAEFVVSLGVMLVASELLTRGLDRAGRKLSLSEGVVGLLAALGADAPEIAAAFSALLAGAHDLGTGVVLGSNLFNLAALLGLGAVVAGSVAMRRTAVVLDGFCSIALTSIAVALAVRWLPAAVGFTLLLLVFAGYVFLLAAKPKQVQWLPLPLPMRHRLARWVVEEREAQEDVLEGELVERHSWSPVWLVLPSLALIVVASDVLVHAALALSTRLGVSQAITGTVVLAGLTSIPNAYAAVAFARRNRGAAMVSAAFNSNALNLIVGLALPALILGQGPNRAWIEGGALLALTLVSVFLLDREGRLSRGEGALLIALYLAFVVLRVVI